MHLLYALIFWYYLFFLVNTNTAVVAINIMPPLSSPPFARLVAALKKHQKTITVIESSCGGLINASILAQPGASAVYVGGSVAYNTRNTKPLLLNNAELHVSLTTPLQEQDGESAKERYYRSKLAWTRQTSIAFCQEVETDFCIAEGGATGPTFRPEGVTAGFSVIAIGARQGDGKVDMIQQEIYESTHADREANMRQFADRAAELALKALGEDNVESGSDPPHHNQDYHDKLHFDRATHLRADEERLEELAKKAYFVVLHGTSALFVKLPQDATDEDLHRRRLKFLTKTEVDCLVQATGAKMRKTFLGILGDKDPVFCVDLLFENNKKEAYGTRFIEKALTDIVSDPVSIENTREIGPHLDSNTNDNELAIHATALVNWQRRAPYCMRCGSETILVDAGNSRTCSGCGDRSWPRQDPSMIVAVSNRDGTKVLLGHSKRHPSGMYSVLAGFIEAGESMERGVAREVFEETGIRIDEDTVRYVASQPWPFPQSTMIGFICSADDTQPIHIDEDELLGAAWFDKSEVELAATVLGPVMQKEIADAAFANNPNLSLLIPPKGVVARTLIDEWLAS